MDDGFREMVEAIKHTADGLIRTNEGILRANEAIVYANEGLVHANEGVKRMADASLHAHEEHEDLRETVRRLEVLVIQQSADIRALRDELRRPPNG